MIKIGNDISVYNNSVVFGGGGEPPEPPQNFFLYSEQFNNAAWSKFGGASIVANSTVAPDGTTTADTIDAANSLYGGIARQTVNLTNGTTYTLSVHLKRNNYDYIGLRISTFSVSGTLYPYINLTTLATNTQGIANLTMGVETLADDWVRVWITYLMGGATSPYLNDIAIVNSSGDHNFTPAGTELVYVWGAQLNEGALKPYGKTEGSIIP